MKLYKYQKDFISWVRNKRREGENFLYLADEQGLGKTIQAIYVSSPGSTLIICPAVLKLNWASEILSQFPNDTVQIINSSKNKVEEVKWVIVNYELAAKEPIAKQLLDNNFEHCILDEAHYLKNMQALRTKVILGNVKEATNLGIVGRCKHVLALSGTPIPNRPIELFPILHRLAWSKISCMDFYNFAMRYCLGYQTPWGFDVSGASNLAELRRAISPIMLRRTKEEVLPELPPKYFKIISLKNSPLSKQLIRKEKPYKKEFLYNVLTAHISLIGLPELRKQMGMLKINPTVDYIIDCLESGENKLVIFGHHTQVLEQIQCSLTKARYSTVLITGKTSLVKRNEYITDFQMNPEVKVFIGNTQAAGIGITLTAASHIIFIEPSWVPSEIAQASDRCHRIGQKNNVLVEFLVFENSLDEYILKKILLKKEVIDQLIVPESSN